LDRRSSSPPVCQGTVSYGAFPFPQTTKQDEEEKLETHPSAKEKEVQEDEKTVTLNDCIELFTQTEKLGPEGNQFN